MSTKKDPVPQKRLSWVISILPMNIALGPVGIYVQLFLLRTDGPHQGLFFITVATLLFNAAGIPAAIIWGQVTDRLHRRKLVIVFSYAITAIYLFSFFFADSTSGVIFLYVLIAFITAASATPLNLLIMETQPKSGWATGFARLSFVASVGAILGYILSGLWAQFLPGLTLWLVLPLGSLALVSIALSAALIQEPKMVFEREVLVMQRPGFFQRLLSSPLIFLNVPRAYDFQRVFQGLRNELTSYVPLLYLSIVVFYLASGIFNTSFVAALSAHSLSDSEIYLVNVAALVAQVATFQVVGPYIARRSLNGVAIQGLILRGASYAALGVASVFIVGREFLIPSLVLFPLSSGFAYGIYYTASNTMIFNSIRGNSQGSSLGVYSAIVGVATMLGSIVSGAVSLYLGFHVTFILAGALLGVAALIAARLSKASTGATTGQ
jgi:MFS family permease